MAEDRQNAGEEEHVSTKGHVPLEELFGNLEEVIEKLEGEDVNLEESFRLYKEGMTLLKKCYAAIDTVEKKVLVLDEDGGTTHEL